MYFGCNNNIIAGCERIIALSVYKTKSITNFLNPIISNLYWAKEKLCREKNKSQNVGKPKSKTHEDFDHDSRQL